MSFTLDNVTFGYPGRPPVLDCASARIEPGALTVVAGPSGAGKSTLLRLLCRLEEPQAGAIAFRGENLQDSPPQELRRRVVYIQQTPTVVSGSVRQNLILPFSFAANRPRPVPADGHLRSLLDEFLLPGVSLGQSALELSVGQKQRVCLIRALLLDPRALLFDEPTSALDPESADVVVKTALRLAAEGATVVYVAHDRDLSAHPGVRSLRLEGGKALAAPGGGVAGSGTSGSGANGTNKTDGNCTPPAGATP
ncbi:MAG: ATP-binding cassette domain-containing protein [Desulfovibrionaceae bacterium]